MKREIDENIELYKLLDYIQPTKFIVKSTNYNDNYKTPVLTPGKSFIKGYTNETEGIISDLPVIIFDDFTTASRFVNFPFKVKSSAMKILKPTSELVNMKYVFYMMQVLNVRSDTHKRYWISIYSKKEIPLPPLPIQRAIVAKIEQLFSELDNGIQNLQQANQKLTVFRQAVLKKAFEGELTGSKMVQRKLESLAVLITKGASPRWQGFDYTNDSNQLLFITSENVREGFISLDKEKYLPFGFNDIQKRSSLQKGDLLFNIVGASIGRAAIFQLDKQANVNQAVALIRLNDQVYNQYVNFYLNSENAKQGYLAKQVDVARANLSLQNVKDIEIPYCVNIEQHRIVQEIESRLSVCDEMEKSIASSLAKAEALRQSILKKAFSGELLTSEEIEQCKNEADWETAEELLARIERSRNARVEKENKNTKRK